MQAVLHCVPSYQVSLLQCALCSQQQYVTLYVGDLSVGMLPMLISRSAYRMKFR
jgi:hypothetical protein